MDLTIFKVSRKFRFLKIWYLNIPRLNSSWDWNMFFQNSLWPKFTSDTFIWLSKCLQYLHIFFSLQDQRTISIWQKISSKCYWRHIIGFLAECCIFHFLHGRIQLFQCFVCLLHHIQHHRIWRHWHFCKNIFIVHVQCCVIEIICQ